MADIAGPVPKGDAVMVGKLQGWGATHGIFYTSIAGGIDTWSVAVSTYTDDRRLRVETLQATGGQDDVNVKQWGGTDTTLGQKVMALSVPVVIASNQSPIAVTTAASVAAATIKAGVLAAGAIGAGYGDLLNPTGDYVQLTILNSLNQTVVISLDAGVTDFGYIPAKTSFTIDFGAVNKRVGNAKIQVKHDGVAATAGKISAAVVLN